MTKKGKLLKFHKIIKGNFNEAIRLQIKDLIEKGLLTPGEKLPSLRILEEELGIHRNTIANAFNDLISEGWLNSIERSGYYVPLDLPSEYFESRYKVSMASKKVHKFSFNNEISQPQFSPPKSVSYNFQSGLPDLRLVPRDELKKIYSEVLKSCPIDVFDYGSPLGHEKLRVQLEGYFRKTRLVNNKTIAVTNGSQEALYIISRLLLRANDVVVMEELSYIPAKTTFLATGAQVISIKNGFDLNELETSFKKNNVKAIYLTPLHHFPTTKCLSISKRIEIYSLCEKYNVFIIEDDYDHEMHFAPPPAPMASEDPGERIIYLSTFSKSIFPGLRLGVVAMPKSLTNAFSEYRRIISHQNERLSQEVMARFIESGGLSRHLRKVRRIYLKRLEIVIKKLIKMQQNGIDIDFDKPVGGLAIWLDIKRDSSEFCKKALENNLFLMPQENFSIIKKSGSNVRLGFSNQNEFELLEGLNIIEILLSR